MVVLDCLDPFSGGRRGDERTGVLASLVANALGSGRPAKHTDFILYDPDKYDPKPKDGRSLMNMMRAMAIAMGGEVNE